MSGDEVTIEVEGRKFPVDKELANLILELNKVGLKTRDCCSGHGIQDAYISFSMDPIVDIVIRKTIYGNMLIVYWKYKEGLKPNYKEIIHSEVKE